MFKLHVDLSEWKCSFELVDCCSLDVDVPCRLIELREDLFDQMNQLNERFCAQAEKRFERGMGTMARRRRRASFRGSIHPTAKSRCRLKVEDVVALMEYLRNELLKMQFLFHSSVDK
jgi:hypothetical protein